MTNGNAEQTCPFGKHAKLKGHSDTKRKEVAEKWTVQYNTNIKPEQINCNGCKSDDIKFFFTESMCEIRKCNIEKANARCATCSGYKCQKTREVYPDSPTNREGA